MSPGHSKKRKPTTNGGANGQPNKKSTAASLQHNWAEARAALHKDIDYQALTLQDVHARIERLCRRVPDVPASGFLLQGQVHADEVDVRMTSETTAETTNGDKGTTPATEASDGDKLGKATSDAATPTEAAASSETAATSAAATATSPVAPENPPTLPQAKYPCPYDKLALREWATAIQTVLEEFHLLVACVSPATYQWHTDRSGAADQNLSLLSNEFVRSQEQLMSRVTPRLNDVLAPVVTLLTDKTVTTKQTVSSSDPKTQTAEIRQNFFITTPEDPDYVNLCHTILARNAPLLRQVVLANFDKLLQAVRDFVQAQQADSQHDARGFLY